MINDAILRGIDEARDSISGLVVKSPLIRSALRIDDDAPIWMKLESLQPTGAFKLRGAANAIGRLSEDERTRGVVCCSTGNHGRAVAYAAREMGVEASICLSSLVPPVKVNAIERLGARIIRSGDSQDDAQLETNRLVAEKGLVEIPPFDHPDIIAGQGTIGLELLEERPELETILVPLSGGGLIAGIALAAKSVKPAIRVIGISMDRGAAMAASLAAARPVTVDEVASLADSLGGGIGLENRYTFDICRELVDEVVLLSEQEIYHGMQALFFEDRLVGEGAAAVGHAAVLAGKVRMDGPAATIISGGNVDPEQFIRVVAGNSVNLGDKTVTGEQYG